MTRTTSKGKCSFCGGVFGKAAIKRHLAGCPQRTALVVGDTTTSRRPLLQLQVEGRYLPMYWMHLEMPATITLDRVDQFLRDQWLECCGHLSVFRINGTSYMDRVETIWDIGDHQMDGIPVTQVVQPEQKFYHEYDFGSPTELTLRIVGEYSGPVSPEDIAILAQNEPPDIACDECGQPATQLCTQCIGEDTGRFCEQHAADHACGEEMLLPVVNSPRCGVCGYEG
ncbi:MAG: plasmid pRiA4b ORF-3 family protein [Chloroflexota bacterium]|nr:plasmid pRiA4b ORF-3 family protein [Chloroflexota bacterium]